LNGCWQRLWSGCWTATSRQQDDQ